MLFRSKGEYSSRVYRNKIKLLIPFERQISRKNPNYTSIENGAIYSQSISNSAIHENPRSIKKYQRTPRKYHRKSTSPFHKLLMSEKRQTTEFADSRNLGRTTPRIKIESRSKSTHNLHLNNLKSKLSFGRRRTSPN